MFACILSAEQFGRHSKLSLVPARLDTLPYGFDSNVTQLPANLLTKPSVFYYFTIVSCNLCSIKLLLLLNITIYPILHHSLVSK